MTTEDAVASLVAGDLAMVTYTGRTRKVQRCERAEVTA